MLTTRKIYWPSVNILGPGALKEAVNEVKKMNLGKAFIVTDETLVNLGVVKKVTDELEKISTEYTIFCEVEENPTMENVYNGQKEYHANHCDYIISIGGGSPQDAAKAVGILVNNGGNIRDYEGLFKSKNKSVPIVAINTTAGTASEVTINYVITDEVRKIKMVMIDSNSLATIAVNDPELMVKKPMGLTAATGMDALTHAIEAYVTKGSYELSDVLALESIKLIGQSLENAVKNGDDIEARSQMAWGSYIAGLSFSNCGLGIVHSLAHQLGSEYNIPHGLANAILLPDVVEYNLSSNYKKFANIAQALGKDISGFSDKKAAYMAVEAIRELSEKIGIPKLNKTIFNMKDINKLSEQAFNDICAGGNPKEINIKDLKELYTKVYNR
ncbi:MAG: iron-containing alcohol dehydrogenase [Cetobacterium sp.]|uniref:iron-containing alcohol dehydrogenase n=1 Tax=Cetobacterium sp. TaxID=2071632 RepID=UPI002FCB2255